MSSEERFNLTAKGKAYLDSLESSPTKPRKPDEVDRLTKWIADEARKYSARQYPPGLKLKVDQAEIAKRIRSLMARREMEALKWSYNSSNYSGSWDKAWKQYRKETRRK